MKKYKLLKPLLELPEGTEITLDGEKSSYRLPDNKHVTYRAPEWLGMMVQDLSFAKSSIKDITESKGRWKPDRGQGYYTIDATDVMGYPWMDDEIDNSAWIIGNVFQTYELAQAELDKRLATQRVIDWMMEHEAVHTGNVCKYYIRYDKASRSFSYGYFSVDRVESYTLPHFEDSTSTDLCIKECESDLKIIFGIK